MKRFSIIIIAVLLLNPVMAQLPPWYKNMEKYWWYRYRLVNDFMKIGDKAGESIPATTRNTSDHGWLDSDVNPNLYTNNSLHWHDATVALGHYISTLATEYRQLSKNGKSTARTEYELMLALKAFDRLDAFAETYCYNVSNNIFPGSYPGTFSPGFSGYPPGNNFNGFFIRDDVPYGNFIQDNYQHFNRMGITDYQPNPQFHMVDHVRDAAFMGRYQGPLPNGQNAYAANSWPGNVPRYPSEESQDQVVDLFLGMALTNKYVGSIPLKGQATDALFRMIRHPMAGSQGFRIRNPLTGNCVYGIHASNPPNCNAGGAEFSFSSVPATRANTMVAGTYNPGAYLPQAVAFEQLAFASYDYAFQLQQLLTADAVFDIYFNDVFVAFARDWVLGQAFPNINTSWKRIVEHAVSGYFAFPHIPLVYKLNYPGGGVGWYPQMYVSKDGLPLPSYEYLLNAAPACGVYDYNGIYGSKEWNGDDRLSDSRHRKDIGSAGTSGYDNADFNGLDYMFLFNLYSLVQGNYLQGITNSYYRENFNVDYPTSTGLGSTSQKLTLNFLEYLSLINKINPGGYVTFRGAKQIELLPGFDAKYGSVTNIYIKDYNFACDNPNAGDYHFAYLTTPIVNMSKGVSIADADSEETVPFEYLPDGSGYIPESDSLDYSVEDSIAASMVNSGTDSLLFAQYWQQIINSGDSDLINYFKSIKGFIPGSGGNYKKINNSSSSSGSIVIFPNPNHGDFMLSINTPGDYVVKVMNVLGNIMYETRLNDNEVTKMIHLSDISPGNYFLCLYGKNENSIHKLIITK